MGGNPWEAQGLSFSLKGRGQGGAHPAEGMRPEQTLGSPQPITSDLHLSQSLAQRNPGAASLIQAARRSCPESPLPAEHTASRACWQPLRQPRPDRASGPFSSG